MRKGKQHRRNGIAAKRAPPLLENGLLAPTAERLQHGPVIRQKRVIDEEGTRAVVWQGLDTIGIMLARGAISSRMHEAGTMFHSFFRKAGLDRLRSADLERVPVQLAGGRWWDGGGGSEAARLQIVSALDALGGVNSPGGSCAWSCLGLEMSLRRWAISANFGRRRIDHVVASGILIADLGILEAHWLPASGAGPIV